MSAAWAESAADNLPCHSKVYVGGKDKLVCNRPAHPDNVHVASYSLLLQTKTTYGQTNRWVDGTITWSE